MVIMSKSFNLLQEESESLILLPALFGSTACMSNELLAFGEQATNHDRMWAIALMVTAIVLLTIAAAFSSRLNKIRVVAKSGDA
jgi:hypothetical protein